MTPRFWAAAAVVVAVRRVDAAEPAPMAVALPLNWQEVREEVTRLEQAKLLEANPVLLRLKELELLGEVAHNVGNITIVAGVDDIVRAFSGRQLSQG